MALRMQWLQLTGRTYFNLIEALAKAFLKTVTATNGNLVNRWTALR